MMTNEAIREADAEPDDPPAVVAVLFSAEEWARTVCGVNGVRNLLEKFADERWITRDIANRGIVELEELLTILGRAE